MVRIEEVRGQIASNASVNLAGGADREVQVDDAAAHGEQAEAHGEPEVAADVLRSLQVVRNACGESGLRVLK